MHIVQTKSEVHIVYTYIVEVKIFVCKKNYLVVIFVTLPS